MNAEAGYQVQTDYFEGPLDLLLHLIRKNRLNILEIRISQITSEYLFYLENNRGINPSRESDFLMTAATLVYIKSRRLLPRLEDEPESEENQLLHSLIEYDKVQKISQLLQQMEADAIMLWRREIAGETFSSAEYYLEEVSAFQLAEIFFAMVKRQDGEKPLPIAAKKYSIEHKKNELLHLLQQEGYLNFSEYLKTLRTVEEVMVSFFTMLEMIKRHLVTAVQKKLFAPIQLWPKNKPQSTH